MGRIRHLIAEFEQDMGKLVGLCLCRHFVGQHFKSFSLKSIGAIHTIPAVTRSDIKPVRGSFGAFVHRLF